MVKEEAYFETRSNLLNTPEYLLNVEQQYMLLLLDILQEAAKDIHADFFVDAQKLLPFWKNYPPEQRGRQPTGSAIPLLELGEKTLSSNLIRALSKKLPNLNFTGLPSGGDIRFSTTDAYIHFDIKLTGPNDTMMSAIVNFPRQHLFSKYDGRIGIIQRRKQPAQQYLLQDEPSFE